MANRDDNNGNPSDDDPGHFSFLAKTVLGLTIFSAICQMLITWVGTFYAPPDQWPHFATLVDTFKHGWESGLTLFVGLFGGKHLK